MSSVRRWSLNWSEVLAQASCPVADSINSQLTRVDSRRTFGAMVVRTGERFDRDWPIHAISVTVL